MEQEPTQTAKTSNELNDELIASWAAQEYANWPSRFIPGQDDEQQRGKIEQMHRTAVIALAQYRKIHAQTIALQASVYRKEQHDT
jgi:hypothetical protein